jgi:hypothetical protein
LVPENNERMARRRRNHKQRGRDSEVARKDCGSTAGHNEADGDALPAPHIRKGFLAALPVVD